MRCAKGQSAMGCGRQAWVTGGFGLKIGSMLGILNQKTGRKGKGSWKDREAGNKAAI
jgi:hypothetical protein